MQTLFNYDVAFSFLEADQVLAITIDNLLKDRLKTFIYTDRQAEIAGTDGEKIFNQVFGKEARMVVILYRPQWGSTPWTRIEETAIRNRGYEEGYDFVLFVMLEKGISPSQWLPKNRLWFGFERWGVQGLASIIEARVQEVGGEVAEGEGVFCVKSLFNWVKYFSLENCKPHIRFMKNYLETR